MTNYTDEELEDGLATVESSEVRKMITGKLYGSEELVRPSEIMDDIINEAETSDGNFYMALKSLRIKGDHPPIVDRIEKKGRRATLYQLTDYGEELIENYPQLSISDEESQMPVEEALGVFSTVQYLCDEERYEEVVEVIEGLEERSEPIEEYVISHMKGEIQSSRDAANHFLKDDWQEFL